jgi:hypothetical protein
VRQRLYAMAAKFSVASVGGGRKLHTFGGPKLHTR